MASQSEETRAIPDSEGDKTAMPISGGAGSAAVTGFADEPVVLALPVGTRLNEFEITSVIGEGGFGIVYAARDHSLERAVAVKEYMPGALATRTQGTTVSVRSNRHVETFQLGLRSFVNEAKLLARTDHPSLVKVYRFWEANGTAYMAMPQYHGETFKSRLKQLSAPPDEAWLRTLLSSLLDALEVIHAENVFHRDIAPDNIMLLEEDLPVLLDFGAARRVIGDATQGLTVILKPGYAPIEQYAEVKSMKQGAWTDLYALAATVHFAITGKPPDPAVGRMISDSLKPMVEAGHGRYSEGFLAAMDAALRVKPEERPQHVAAFRALLNAAPAAAPFRRATQPQPASKAPDTARDGNGTRVPLIAGGITLVAALAAGGYFYLNQGGAPVAPPAADKPVAVSPTPVPAPETPTPVVTTTAANPAPEATPAPEQKPVPPTVTATAPTSVPTPPPIQANVAKPPPPAQKPPAAARKTGETPDVTAAIDEQPPVRIERVPLMKPPPAVNPYGQAPGPGLDQESYRQPASPRDNVQVNGLVAQAQQSLARREFRRAAGLAENVLALDPSNAQARDIRRRAQDGEKRAFEEIKIE